MHLAKIVESFMCIWYAEQEFSQRVKEARITVQMAEDEANAAGPRSIAEVRRERQRQLELRARSNPIEDWDAVLDENNVAMPQVRVPKNVNDIAQLELHKNCVNIAMVWVCRWADKIRWGIHYSPHVGLHHTESNALSNIHISVEHDREIVRGKLSTDAFIVPVKVKVRSLSYQTVKVSVRAQVNRKPGDTSENSVQRVHSPGFTWLGKIAYEDITLPAQQDTTLDFAVEIFANGIYDLNK
jgi:hypothetical protein